MSENQQTATTDTPELPSTTTNHQHHGKNWSPSETLNAFNANNTNWTKIILQHPMACNASLSDTCNTVWNSRTSMCISNDKRDFPDGIQPITNAKVDGITIH